MTTPQSKEALQILLQLAALKSDPPSYKEWVVRAFELAARSEKLIATVWVKEIADAGRDG